VYTLVHYGSKKNRTMGAMRNPLPQRNDMAIFDEAYKSIISSIRRLQRKIIEFWSNGVAWLPVIRFISVTVEVGAGGPKVLGWRVGRYWVLDDGLRDTRGDGGQIAREDVLLPETESDRIQKALTFN
jgi:hypothetical protein